jgi:hypothetical protein
VLTLDDRFAPYVHSVAGDVGPAQVVEQGGPHVGILGRAALRLVPVAHYEERHLDLLDRSLRSDRIISRTAGSDHERRHHQ